MTMEDTLEVCPLLVRELPGFIYPKRRKQDMVKLKLTNKQKAFEYAMYMIAASYFEKAQCRNIFLEKNLFMQYQEQKKDNQYQMEEISIAFMDDLQQKLPSRFFQQSVKVYLRKNKNDLVQILFVSEKNILILEGRYQEEETTIKYKILRKKKVRKKKVRKKNETLDYR